MTNKFFIYSLFIFFGIGTGVDLNGIWTELPLIVPRVPEHSSVSSQMGMLSDVANVAPLFIALIHRLTHGSSSYEVPAIILIYSVYICMPFLLSFTWFKTLYFIGQQRSIYLLVCTFCVALGACSINVTFLPFLNRFDKYWLNVYFAGESLSSLVPALLGLIQGVPKQPNCTTFYDETKNQTRTEAEHFAPLFTVEIYFLCLSAIMCLSLTAFLILWRGIVPTSKQQGYINLSVKQITEHDSSPQKPLCNITETSSHNVTQNNEKFTREAIICLIATLWSNFILLGCMPSITSYALNPYGTRTYHYIIILCEFCYPFVSLVSMLKPKLFQLRSLSLTLVVCFSTIMGTSAFAYIFVAAKMAPCSPLVDYLSGKILIVRYFILKRENDSVIQRNPPPLLSSNVLGGRL
ncbi:unnamed protein product [Didymodactylos carnosus]|uniref:Riboflavin transporter n=1 Tax=Didymodactylos carnosus TaxID=1234261 RepID=A0A815HB96_9BILA|nr:unnamed protein product [Didymodactylos carnosus]CAF1350027.1 unnamed protein product [Didymodactylos carnosus]CAF4081560.1 unnamed protein product [Didymodactylos carnosus]CAF4219314.1 unnamed protein product [Didymodactylos carnosus]